MSSYHFPRRQQHVCRIVRSRKTPPTLAEIGAEMGITREAVRLLVGKLVKRGALAMTPYTARSIRVLP